MRFNIRVYGVLTDAEMGVLVSDELIQGKYYVKFPGGGMEFGEGTRDCLKREFKEELNLEIEVLDHLYTTDFYQRSAFRKEDQIISVYYNVRPLGKINLNTTHFRDTNEMTDGQPHADKETFRFIPFGDFSEDVLSFPIDKIVGRILKKRF